MQMGIISNNPTGGSIALGLIDYKATNNTETPTVIIEWTETPKGYRQPVVAIPHTKANALASIGKICTAVDKLKAKHKDAVNDPARLISLLQKQMGRHVFWDDGKWAIVPRVSKDNVWSEPVLGLTVTASDEDQARSKLAKELGVKIADNQDKLETYLEWIKEGQPVSSTKSNQDIPPLSNYYIQQKAKAND